MKTSEKLLILTAITCGVCSGRNGSPDFSNSLSRRLQQRALSTPSLSDRSPFNHTLPVTTPIASPSPLQDENAGNSSGVGLVIELPRNNSDPCAVYPLDQSTWNQLHWDEYIQSVPGGTNLSVQVELRVPFIPRGGLGESFRQTRFRTDSVLSAMYQLLGIRPFEGRAQF